MFKNKRINRRSSLTILFALAILILAGCKDEGKKIGVEIPEDIQPVKISAVLEEPDKYNGKQVVINGIITGQCASMCELFVRDGAHKATLFAEGFKFPRLEKGKPVSIYANVTAGQDNVVFSALGVHVKQRKEI